MTTVIVLAGALAKLYCAHPPLGMRLGLGADARGLRALREPGARRSRAVHVAGGYERQGQRSARWSSRSRARRAGGRASSRRRTSVPVRRAHPASRGSRSTTTTLAATLTRVLDGAPDLSVFESATLAAFVAFREAKGRPRDRRGRASEGRLDATNVLPLPRAAAITRIALDHAPIGSGPTLVDIAREKAGIAKAGLDLVLGARCPRRARRHRRPLAHACRARRRATPPRRRSCSSARCESASRATTSATTPASPPPSARANRRVARRPIDLRSSRASAGRVASSAVSERAGPDAPTRGFLLDAAHQSRRQGRGARAPSCARSALPRRDDAALVFGALGGQGLGRHARTRSLRSPSTRVYVAPQGRLALGDRPRGARGAPQPAERSGRPRPP